MKNRYWASKTLSGPRKLVSEAGHDGSAGPATLRAAGHVPWLPRGTSRALAVQRSGSSEALKSSVMLRPSLVTRTTPLSHADFSQGQS